MSTFKCLIVDDEPVAREIIETYCSHLQYLSVAASCDNALDAKQFLQRQPIDIMFLDINMPLIDGISFLKTLKNAPQVIFTTAYKEHAHLAFDLAATDYLLKPFSFDRFIIAIDKVVEKLKAQPIAVSDSTAAQDFIFIKTEGKIFKIKYEDLLFAEASGNNTRIVTTQQTIISSLTFTNLEEMLPSAIFLRVHRSFIVNKSRIRYVQGNIVMISNKEIPIGSNYKASFLKELGFSKE